MIPSIIWIPQELKILKLRLPETVSSIQLPTSLLMWSGRNRCRAAVISLNGVTITWALRPGPQAHTAGWSFSGKEITPFELQPKAIMPKNVQPNNLWGLAPVEKTSVKGMSWWKTPPGTPVGLPEGMPISPETEKMVVSYYEQNGPVIRERRRTATEKCNRPRRRRAIRQGGLDGRRERHIDWVHGL